jgi:hypothetical protein
LILPLSAFLGKVASQLELPIIPDLAWGRSPGCNRRLQLLTIAYNKRRVEIPQIGQLTVVEGLGNRDRPREVWSRQSPLLISFLA